MGSLYLWGCSIQEMGGDVVIGRSIYGVVVIEESLYSHFYSIPVFVVLIVLAKASAQVYDYTLLNRH